MAAVKLACTFFLVISQLIGAISAPSELDVLPGNAQLDEKWGISGHLSNIAKGVTNTAGNAAANAAIVAAQSQLKGTATCTNIVPALADVKTELVDTVVERFSDSRDCELDLKGPKCEKVIVGEVNLVVMRKLRDSLAGEDQSVAMAVLTPVVKQFMTPELVRSIQEEIPDETAMKLNSGTADVTGPLKAAIRNPVGKWVNAFQCDLCAHCGVQKKFSTAPQVVAVAQHTPPALFFAATILGIMMVGIAVGTLRWARARANLRRVQVTDPEETLE